MTYASPRQVRQITKEQLDLDLWFMLGRNHHKRLVETYSRLMQLKDG